MRMSQAKTGCASCISAHPLKSAKGGAAGFLSAFVVVFFTVPLGNFVKFAAASPRNSAGSANSKKPHFPARFMQLACDDESVAAVVAFAADDAECFGRGIRQQSEFCHCRSSVLHQRERRHAEAFAGDAIDLAHFGGGDDFHDQSRLAKLSCNAELTLDGRDEEQPVPAHC